MRRALAMLCGFALGWAAQRALALPPLAELEARLAHSPQAELDDRAYEAARATLRAGDLQLEPSVVASASLGEQRDIIDAHRTYGYTQAGGSVGLSLPLLGSRLRVQAGLSDQQVQLVRLKMQRALARRAALQSLIQAYAQYWRAQRTQLLAEQYLSDRASVVHALDLRTSAGLLLDSDRLELESSFDLARRDAAAAAASQQDALEQLSLLTGTTLQGGEAAPPPRPDCQPRDASAWERSDPELQGLRRIVQLRRQNPRDNPLYPIQSSIQVGYQGIRDLSNGQFGNDGAIVFTFQVPLEYRSERRLMSEAADAELARARLEYQLRREELTAQRHELIERRVALRASLSLASAQLAAGDAATHERALRAAQLGGDVIEQLERARLERYHAAVAVVDAEARLADWSAEWARFANPADCTVPDSAPGSTGAPGDAGRSAFDGAGSAGPPPLAAAHATAAPPTADRADAARAPLGRDLSLYVWQAGAWLHQAGTRAGARELARLRAAGISRLLISLDATQLASALHDSAALASAVLSTERQGVQVAWLLGDPSWITPGHRLALVRIVQQLHAVPFEALHLDLEPEQLGAPHPATAGELAELGATLRAVAAVSPWPIELSTHPRNLGSSAADAQFAAQLQQLRIEPTVMVYSANVAHVVSVAAPLLQRYPQLHFRVAVSLESAAPPGESLGVLAPGERDARIARIEQQLQAANFDGLVLEMHNGWSLARPGAGGS